MNRTPYLLAALSLIFLPGAGIRTVTKDAALKTANQFYTALLRHDIPKALDYFDSSFKANETKWPTVLGMLDQQGGAVTKSELKEASPVKRGESACYVMTYHVNRERVTTDENLYVCEIPGKVVWEIVGQTITRLDTSKRISAGYVLESKGAPFQ
jgi:hypothetical protein